MAKAITWVLTTLSEFGMWVIADIWHAIIVIGIILLIAMIARAIFN